MNQEFLEIIKPIVKNEHFQKLKKINHHNSTRFNHSLLVAYYNYKFGKKFEKKLNLNIRSLVLIGLCHDLFFYDKFKCPKGQIAHIFYHAEIALENAEKIFELTDGEREAILNHMFPLCKNFPRHKETWILTMSDKYSTIMEILFNKNLENTLVFC